MRAAASGQPRSVALFGHASTACDVVRAAASIHSWDAHSVPPLQPSFSKLHALLLSTCHADSDSLDADSVPDWSAPFLPTVFASCSALLQTRTAWTPAARQTGLHPPSNLLDVLLVFSTQIPTAWMRTACQAGQHPSFQQCSPPALLCCRLGQPGRRQHARLVCTLLPICLTYCSFSPRRFRQPGCGQRARQV